MLNHYLVLGLKPGAKDEEIKNRFLDLVKTYPPEKDAKKFRQINSAYEALKNKRLRIRAKMFDGILTPDLEVALLELASAMTYKKKRVTLKELVRAAQPSGR